MASKGNNSFWIPLSDLMTVLMVTFLFIAVVYMAKVQLATKGITELKASKQELLDELNKEFKEDFSAMMFGVVKEIIQRGVNQGI